jgi:hypothetical protein
MTVQKVVVVLLFSLLCVQSTYIVMTEGQTKCFRSEVPQDTLIVGTFKSEPLLDEVSLGNSVKEYSPGVWKPLS